MRALAFVICALAAAEQPGGGRVERLTVPGELVGRHLVPLLSPRQGLVLAAPSRGGEPLSTTLLRWQDGATTRLAVIPGVRANRIQELRGVIRPTGCCWQARSPDPAAVRMSSTVGWWWSSSPIERP